jgi:hypothetical protein
MLKASATSTPAIDKPLELQNDTAFFVAVGFRPIVQHLRGCHEKFGRHG